MAIYQAYYRGNLDGNVAETNTLIVAPNNGLAVALARHYLPPEFKEKGIKESESKLVRLVKKSNGKEIREVPLG